MKRRRWKGIAAIGPIAAAAGAATAGTRAFDGQDDDRKFGSRKARNVIFFIGDGMGVSTVTAARVFSVGVDGQLVARPVSAHGAVAHVLRGLHHAGQRADDVGDDDRRQHQPERHRLRTRPPNRATSTATATARRPWTLLELAKRRGMKVGAVSTATITHATPAATYAHINQRNNENDIALQALPTDATYNERLGRGLDILMGGGRRFFVPNTSSTKKACAAPAPTAGTCGRSSRRRATTTSGTQTGFDAVEEPAGARAVREQPHGVRVRPAHRPRRRAEPQGHDGQGDPAAGGRDPPPVGRLLPPRRGRAASTTRITPATPIARSPTRRSWTRPSAPRRRWSTCGTR